MIKRFANLCVGLGVAVALALMANATQAQDYTHNEDAQAIGLYPSAQVHKGVRTFTWAQLDECEQLARQRGESWRCGVIYYENLHGKKG